MKTLNTLLTNEEIYQIALGLNANFSNNETYFPAQVSFAIQKNKALLLPLAEEVDNGRNNIIKHYGVEQENGSYLISEENVVAANNELNDLLQISQEVKLFVINIEALNDIKLTNQEMQTLLFMIDAE
jgi:hypothetical protein